jgi:hypothetical protein
VELGNSGEHSAVASSRTPEGCSFGFVREAALSASSIGGRVQRLAGGQLIPEALSPLLSLVPLFKGCDKLTLTLTATMGRVR